MIYIYPANKMENLLALFNKIQQVSPLSLFEQEHIIVQNAGMQHWLNMSIAQSRGIAMNIEFALPAQYLWKLLREIASEDEVPEQSLYSREVLVWRIYQLLSDDIIALDPTFEQATQYWQASSNASEQQQKRYQLAMKVADLYEQYLIFRPNWIDNWSQQDFVFADEDNVSDDTTKQTYYWQGKLWYLLQQRQEYNPVALMSAAAQRIAEKAGQLPKRVSFFGINALPPMWINFLEMLGEHIDIHFFHLNPCADYWGDIQTEKQFVKQLFDERLSQWTDEVENLASAVGNPLLANWGQQGREFLAQLQQVSTVNIDVFEQHTPDEQFVDNDKGLPLLTQLQQDVLNLADARQAPSQLVDDSLTVTSCHSAFREVQALHDWLLHQLNQDPSLTPKDILVMCPEIEQYAPFVHAVFTRGWQDLADDVPPLPCSIADRNVHNADPLVATFVDLLTLPDSRFHVTSIIAMLRLEAVQQQFNLTSEDVVKLSAWLEHAAVHWGLSKNHKEQVLGASGLTDAFTWQQGLSKLLQGFAYGDELTVAGEQLLLPDVEGQDAFILGQLMLFLEHLADSSQQLNQPKTPEKWQQYLAELVAELYHPAAAQSIDIIYQALGLLTEYTHTAEFNQAYSTGKGVPETLDLLVVREFLTAHFSTPDTGRQFMIGQVTFCSMLPMRSIPFKIIAVLGLNDGEYPRQRQPLAFDLMNSTPAKLGDRSRRGDDRYLFLEALISARDKLYLSYQGRSVQNNKVREPSIILQELFDYLTAGYGWQCDLKTGSHIRQMPLQAFSLDNYRGPYPSFDAHWLKLGSANTTKVEDTVPSSLVGKWDVTGDNEKSYDNGEQMLQLLEEDIEIELNDLIRFYQHPSRWYAQRVLGIYYEQTEPAPSDVEQFSYDRLASYQLKQALLTASLSESSELANEEKAQALTATVNDVRTQARLSGRFADTPLTAQLFDKWQEDNDVFSQAIVDAELGDTELTAFSLPTTIDITLGQLKSQEQTNVQFLEKEQTKLNCIIRGSLPTNEQVIGFYRPSTAKAKDLFSLYLARIISTIATDNGHLEFENKPVIGLYFDTKQQKVSQYLCQNSQQINDAKAQLNNIVNFYLLGQQKPLLINADIAHKAFNARKFEQAQLENYWYDENNMLAPGYDPYMQFFWPQCPAIDDMMPMLNTIYEPMYQVLSKSKR
ncbi:exodeoxyribonuclease V subunit gamma [Thalassotalea euphylliae]|uniref:RecBCD enzyme subunit RecC n=1 Tax=Thalassotalea euphylliae TaxID=1655234 RepID=A0A3E0UET7_9GAMM|nr:exodeoxyribonuclease V subunit gamma [Thalassotalea euphylliae]REL35541.1 exodeoxyribonuclease V subunit gamma [Thalassotalea euphylliae]